tara:strand:+ start:472 stop:735 length:264 start_codon:yes stop_codon:yes gene_type:complete
MNKLHYSEKELLSAYAQALEYETGIPVADGFKDFVSFDNYELNYNRDEDKVVIVLTGVFMLFSDSRKDITLINTGHHTYGKGWRLGY